MHPRCRSTISAVVEGGTRTAKGKNIKVPAEMKYGEFKAVYIDKTAPRANNLLQESTSGAIIRKANSAKPTRIADIKDIEDANNFAMNVLGIPRASYVGCSVEVAKEWNSGLQAAFEQFPELKKAIRFVGESSERRRLIQERLANFFEAGIAKNHPKARAKEMATQIAAEYISQKYKNLSDNALAGYCSGFKIGEDAGVLDGLILNGQHANNAQLLIEKLRQAVATNFHPAGCDTIKSLLDHEIGHILDEMLGISELKEIRKLFDGKSKSEITAGLSEYAWNNSNGRRYAEFVAEAWAEYCNNPSPRRIATAIGKIIEGAYKRRFHYDR